MTRKRFRISASMKTREKLGTHIVKFVSDTLQVGGGVVSFILAYISIMAVAIGR